MSEPYYGQGPNSWRVRAMQQIQKQKQTEALPPGWPTLQEQREYWERKERLQRDYVPNDEFVGGENDWRWDEQQYSNHENHEL